MIKTKDGKAITLKKLLHFTSLFLFILFIILASIFTVANNESFFRHQYEKNDTGRYTGMSEDDYVKSSNVLMDYMSGKRDDMYVEAEKFGKVEPVFNERETSHMVDVRALYINAWKAMFIFFGLSMIIAGILVIREGIGGFLEGHSKAVLPVAAVYLVFGVMMAGFFIFGFNWFWINFHHVFFPNNDLWLLDPATSTMINMFPEEFFLAMCSRILIMFVVVTVLVLVGIKVAAKRVKNG